MSSTILLVEGDNLPNVQVTLTNTATGKPLDLSAATNGFTPTLTAKMRQMGTTTVLAVIPVTFVNSGSDGLVEFAFAGNTLQVAAGMYEFEIDINWNGSIQTVFDTLRARVRQRF